MIFDLETPIQNISRITPAYSRRLMKLGIKTLRDLFYHFPYRYDDFSNIKKIAELKVNEVATICGEIVKLKNIRTWKKRMTVTEAYVRDDTGLIRAIWFNQPYLTNTLKENTFVSLAGKINPVRNSNKAVLKNNLNITEPHSLLSNGVNFDKDLYLSNPAWERISPITNCSPRCSLGEAGQSSKTTGDDRVVTHDLRHTGGLIPVYPETAGLSSKYLRYLIKLFLPSSTQIKDWLPPEIKRFQNLINLEKAIRQIHFPGTQREIQQAKRRLAFDEMFLIQLFVKQQKNHWQMERAIKIPFGQPLIKSFLSSLPFSLTDAQRKVAWEIFQDMEKTKPMNRLLEGDVGSGKTVVAAMAALEVAQNGWQTAFMAPTEILAQQHYYTLCKLLANFNIKIGLITGRDKKLNYESPCQNKFGARQATAIAGQAKIINKEKHKRQILSSLFIIYNSDIIVGTHALIAQKMEFKNLALAIIDEQHRFGVNQRYALARGLTQKNTPTDAASSQRNSAFFPHLLSMTATPIPRTLALTVFGDLDISLLDEMPKGRTQIITKIVSPQNRQSAYEFIRGQIKTGRQVFVICPRIEVANDHRLNSNSTNENPICEIRGSFVKISDNIDTKAVKEEYEKLSKNVFPEFKIGVLHGKLPTAQKEKIMSDFKAGKINIIVSTSVIEVGVDIPNASVMMIEGADRFGLAQLHQFRGRVGRDTHQSYCFLLTDSSSLKTNVRLKALLTAKNGFELAEKDLALRGPGQFYGTQQWGLPDLAMASLADLPLIQTARQSAAKLLQTDPDLKKYPALAERIKEFKLTIHLE